MDNENPISRIEFWEEKFKNSLNEQIELNKEINSDSDINTIKEKWLINKLATLMVGCELLGDQIRTLESIIDKTKY